MDAIFTNPEFQSDVGDQHPAAGVRSWIASVDEADSLA